MPDTVAEKLVYQQSGDIPARVTGAEHAERAGQPRPLRAPGKRHGLPGVSPVISAPAFPAALISGNHEGWRADTPGCTLDLAAHVKPGHAPGTGTGTPSSGYPHRSGGVLVPSEHHIAGFHARVRERLAGASEVATIHSE